MGLETPEFNSILAPNHNSHQQSPRGDSILHLKVTFQRKQVNTSRVVQLLHDVTDMCRNVSFSFRLNAQTSVSCHSVFQMFLEHFVIEMYISCRDRFYRL